MNRMEALIERRLETRRSTASVCVERILEDARKHGTKIRVIGSLAKRNFHLHSDVDLLVGGSIDPARRLFVEQLVAAHMRGTGIPYDLIFEADLTTERIQELLDDCSGLPAFSRLSPKIARAERELQQLEVFFDQHSRGLACAVVCASRHIDHRFGTSQFTGSIKFVLVGVPTQ
jgi:predicted nucleotidyltransferase